MNDDLTTALGDLAGTMTDDPRRLHGVHQRARTLRARRTARRGVVATGALGVAAATGILVRPSGSAGGSTDTQVAATQPDTPPTDLPNTTELPAMDPSCFGPERPESDFPILEAFTKARVLSVDGDDITFELIDRPADTGLPETMTLTLGQYVTWSAGDVGIEPPAVEPGMEVQIWVVRPQNQTGWEVSSLVIDPADVSVPADLVIVPNGC